jgi:hypothetical protein
MDKASDGTSSAMMPIPHVEKTAPQISIGLLYKCIPQWPNLSLILGTTWTFKQHCGPMAGRYAT